MAEQRDNSNNDTPKLPVLPAVATAAAPAWTENRNVPLSVDLSGALRSSGGGGGGGAVTIADGADVAQGAKADAAWVAGDGTVISLLKKIASAGGSAVSIADGANVVEGTVADAAVVTDANGTLSGKLRGLVKWAFERMPASLGQKAMAASLPVVVASDQSAVPVSGPLTDTQLRASAVPVSGTVTASGPLTDTQLRASAVPVSIGGTVQVDVTDEPTRDLGKLDVASLDQYTPVAGRLPVDGSGVTQPISAASLPIPTGAATEATLALLLAASGGTTTAGFAETVREGYMRRLEEELLVTMTTVSERLTATAAGRTSAF